MTHDEAFALLLANFKTHGDTTPDFEAALSAWLLAPSKDGTPRPKLLASTDGPRELGWIADRVRVSKAIPHMVAERPGRVLDRYLFRAVVQLFNSQTRWCDDDPPPAVP